MFLNIKASHIHPLSSNKFSDILYTTTYRPLNDVKRNHIISKTQQNYMISNLPKCQRQTNTGKIILYFFFLLISFHSLWLQVKF